MFNINYYKQKQEIGIIRDYLIQNKKNSKKILQYQDYEADTFHGLKQCTKEKTDLNYIQQRNSATLSAELCWSGSSPGSLDDREVH